MCFLTFFLLFALIAALASAVPAAVSQAAPTVPPAGGVSLVSLEVTLDGSSGCRPGTVSALLASDYSAITLLFDQFSAADGPKAGNAKKRAFCRVSIGMAAPGWAFDVTSADFRGYVLLEKGVNATIESRWKWVLDGQDLKGKVYASLLCVHCLALIVSFTGEHPEDCPGPIRRRFPPT